jgi:hypothetical protein
MQGICLINNDVPDCESVEDPLPIGGFAWETVRLLRRLSPASASHTAGTTPVSASESIEFFMRAK